MEWFASANSDSNSDELVLVSFLVTPHGAPGAGAEYVLPVRLPFHARGFSVGSCFFSTSEAHGACAQAVCVN